MQELCAKRFRELVVLVLTVIGTTAAAQMDPGIIKTLDNVRSTVEAAKRDAEAGDARKLSDSLKVANETWTAALAMLYDSPTSDTNWKTDLDTMSTAMFSAVGAYNNGESMSTVKVKLDTVLATLATFRTRNKIPDLRAAIEGVKNSLDAMKTAAQAMQGRKLSADEVLALQTNLGAATSTWTQFCQAVVASNALNLEEGQLKRLRELVAAQDRLFERLNRALSTENRRELVQLLSSEDRPLGGILLLLGKPGK